MSDENKDLREPRELHPVTFFDRTAEFKGKGGKGVTDFRPRPVRTDFEQQEAESSDVTNPAEPAESSAHLARPAKK